MSQPFDGMKERRDRSLFGLPRSKSLPPIELAEGEDPGNAYAHVEFGVAYNIAGAQKGMNEAVHDQLGRIHRVQELATLLADVVAKSDEDIVYDAVDELRRRWHDGAVYGLAQAKTEGGPVEDPPSLKPSYRTAIRDRDEFGLRSIKLARKLRRARRKLRRARKAAQGRVI